MSITSFKYAYKDNGAWFQCCIGTKESCDNVENLIIENPIKLIYVQHNVVLFIWSINRSYVTYLEIWKNNKISTSDDIVHFDLSYISIDWFDIGYWPLKNNEILYISVESFILWHMLIA